MAEGNNGSSPLVLPGGAPPMFVIVLDGIGFQVFEQRGISRTPQNMQQIASILTEHDALLQHLLRDYEIWRTKIKVQLGEAPTPDEMKRAFPEIPLGKSALDAIDPSGSGSGEPS